MKKGIKVLFVYPNPAMDNLIHAGLSLLSASLKKAGHNVKLFDTTFYDDGVEIGELIREKYLQVIKTDFKTVGIERVKRDIIEDFRNTIKDYEPDLIGMTAIEISYPQGLKLLKSIKDFKIPKIVGGIHAINYPNEVIREDCIDILCIGEGEDAVVELADRIRDGQDYSDVMNLWVKKNGKVIRNDLRPLKNLDDLPFQDWEIYDKKRFYKPYLGDIAITGGIESQRGCVGNCTFCCNPVLKKTYKGFGRYLRFKSPEKAVEEVMFLKEKYNLQFIKFLDPDIFARNEEEFEKFAETYKKTGCQFWAEGRADSVTERKAKLLEEMGCKGLAIGIESGNEYIRNEVLKKKISNEQITRASNFFKNSSVELCANVMIGMPYEGRKEIFDTIELIRVLNENSNVRSSVFLFSPYGGTQLRELCIKEGYLDASIPAGDYRHEYVLNMPQISREELLGLYRTFPMYVKLPKSRWSEIKKAEQDDAVFEKLGEEFYEKYLKRE